MKNIFKVNKHLAEENSKLKIRINELHEDIGYLIQIVEMLEKQITGKKKDVTKKYENMIQAFECDFNLPYYNNFTIFDDFLKIDTK